MRYAITARKGMTPVQLIAIAAIILVSIGVALYLNAGKPDTFPVGAPLPAQKPRMAGIIAQQDRAYDTNEYCVGDDYSDMRCEERCGADGLPTRPYASFIDCKPPKICCRYPPAEGVAVEEAPRAGPGEAEDAERAMKGAECEARGGLVCATDDICLGEATTLDGVTCCLGRCEERLG